MEDFAHVDRFVDVSSGSDNEGLPVLKEDVGTRVKLVDAPVLERIYIYIIRIEGAVNPSKPSSVIPLILIECVLNYSPYPHLTTASNSHKASPSATKPTSSNTTTPMCPASIVQSLLSLHFLAFSEPRSPGTRTALSLRWNDSRPVGSRGVHK